MAAHRTHAPGIDPAVEVDPGPVEAGLFTAWPYTELARLPHFGDLSVPTYHRERHLSTEEYVSYLSTKSAYRMLEPQARATLFRAIVDSAGPRVILDLGTALYLARRTAS